METHLPFDTSIRVTELRRRIAALRTEIRAAEEKRTGIAHAIQARRISLQRLEAELAMSESASARAYHE